MKTNGVFDFPPPLTDDATGTNKKSLNKTLQVGKLRI
jgi:hypothetical protein